MVPLCIIFVKQICRHKKMPRLVKDGADMSCRPQSAAFCKKCKKDTALPSRGGIQKAGKRIRLPVKDLQPDQVTRVIRRPEPVQIVDPFADTHIINRSRIFTGNRRHHTAFRRSVQLGNHQS